MIQYLNRFTSNLSSVCNLTAIHTYLLSQVAVQVDISDILRAELVLCVSSFDAYIHDLVAAGMLEIFRGNRIATPSFNQFVLPISSLNLIRSAASATEQEAVFIEAVREKLSYRSFQKADKVKEAVSLIKRNDLWNDISSSVGLTAVDIRTKLNLIIERRDKIVHEADIDPTYTTKWRIDRALVDDSKAFLSQIAEQIYSIVS